MAKRKYVRRKTKKAGPKRRKLFMSYKGSGLTNSALVAAAGSSLYKTMRGMRAKRPNRSMSSAMVPYRRAKTSTSTQISQDYRSQFSKFGYRPKRGKLMRKLLKNELTYNIYSVRNYGIWNRGFGAVQIVANQIGAANTRIDMPVHLWDLTAVPQGNASQSLQYPATYYQLSFTSEQITGSHVWETRLAGAAPSTVSDFVTRSSTIDKSWAWYPTDNNTTIKSFQGGIDVNRFVPPGAKSLLEKVQVKMILNGPQQKPTKWCIQLVQLKQEVTPGVARPSPQTAGPMGPNLADQFWASMAKPYGFSPLDNQMPRRLQKYIKVMKTWYISMDTPESGEDHLRARMRHLTLNLNLNRSLNYNWGPETDRIDLSTADIPENGFAATTNEILCQVHPNARVYLMVRALCEQQLGVAPDNALFPSYDIVLNAVHRGIAD